ncbi:hypothetical protein JHN49_41760 [Streptomyces sp. MBT57]|nr:hypothetical protein [Streptomyces sp. MBT57]
MVDFEGLEKSDVAAALVAGPTLHFTRRTARFRDLIPFWRLGQEAESPWEGRNCARCSGHWTSQVPTGRHR